MKYLTNFNTLLEYEDALILDIPNTSYIMEDKVVKYSEEPKIGNKYILYKSSNELKVIPYDPYVFGTKLILNEYEGFGLISFKTSVTSIGNKAFYYCSSLTSITIPNTVKSIGNEAFDGCSSLKTITCEATSPPHLDAGNDLTNVTEVYVPAESVDAYKTATNWSYYADKIQPIQ